MIKYKCRKNWGNIMKPGDLIVLDYDYNTDDHHHLPDWLKNKNGVVLAEAYSDGYDTFARIFSPDGHLESGWLLSRFKKLKREVNNNIKIL